MTSVFHKNHGEKGYRIHQGERLRDTFLSLIEEQVGSGVGLVFLYRDGYVIFFVGFSSQYWLMVKFI